MNKKLLLAALCFLLMAVSGCETPTNSKEPETNNKTPAVTSVTVSPTAATVAKGGAKTFAAEVAGTNEPARTVLWTVSGNEQAETAFTGNVLNVAAGETAETLTVRASSTADPGKSGEAVITIEGTATVDSVTVSPKTAVAAKGGSVRFIVAVAGTNEPSQTVTWTVSGNNAAETAFADNVLNVAVGETAETLAVRASSAADPGKSGEAAITIEGTATVDSVTVSPKETIVAKGGSVAFTAAVAGTRNPAQTVLWTVSGNTAAGTAFAGNVLTVAAGETATSLAVRASSTVDRGKSGEAAVTVSSKTATVDDERATVAVAGLRIAHDDTVLTLPLGETATLAAVISPADATNKNVTWESNDPGTVTVDENGVARAVAVGVGKITATTEDGGKKAARHVTVTYPVSSIRIITPPTKAKYYLGEAPLDLEGFEVEAAYSNGDPPGLVTIEPIQIAGFTGITATVGEGKSVPLVVAYGGQTAQFTHTVSVRYKITNVTVSPAQQQAVKGDRVYFHAVVAAAKETPPQAVTWSIDGTTNGTTAGGSVITENGILTVGANETESLTIRATSTYADYDGWKESGTAAISIAADTAITKYAINDEDDWNAAFAAITAAGDGTADSIKVYELNIAEDFSVAGITDYYTGNTASEHIEVRLTGTNKISLNSPGSIVKAMANQTFIIDGPTLSGYDGNTEAVVKVIDGSLELKNGTIRDNTMTTYGGEGVRVTRGTFTMNGGTISGNSASRGGGVYLTSSTFTMNGGTISGNTARTFEGGGVHMNGDTFTMKGGTMSGNTAKTNGGGVYIQSGTFTMTGGTMSGNKATNYGGGVWVSVGPFTMNGGIIYGKDETDVLLRNTATGGSSAVFNQFGSSKDTTVTSYP